MTTQRDLTFHWFLPTNGGDGRHVVGGGHGLDPGAAGRPASVPFLGQVARAAEDVGFEPLSHRPAPGARTRGCPPRC